MPDELEAKLRVSDHDALRGRARDLGATFQGRALEINRLFDDAQATLLRTQCGLRVRECQCIEGEPRPATLTYKGPPRPGPFKHRSEIEVSIGDTPAMIEILHGLGFTERIVFEKRRESWRVGNCRVELDELPKLGCFIEIEGPTKNEIHQALAWLGLSPDGSIRKSYVALLTESSPSGGSAPLTFRF